MDEDTADRWVIIELLDSLNDVFHGRIFRDSNVLELDTDFLGSLCFHANIDTRVGSCASLDDNQLGLKAGELRLQSLDTTCNIIANGSRDTIGVQ